MSRRRLIIVAAIAALPILLLVGSMLASVWTELLWYGELGYERIFWTRILAHLAVAAVGGVVFFAVFLGNLYLARRLSPRIRMAGTVGGDDVLELVPVHDHRFFRAMIGVSLVLAFFFALGAGGAWTDVLLFLRRVPFNYKDPVFNLDAGFFVYVLPMARDLLSFLTTTIVVTFLGTVAIYVLDRAITVPDGRRLVLSPHVKAHLSSLAAAALLLKAGGYVVSAYELVLSPRGVIFGAGYTDVHADLPVLRLLAIVAVASALILLVNIHYKGWRLPIAAVGLLAVMWLVAGQIYPALVQQYRVSPNEIEAERPYIDDNIASTRWAFALDRVLTAPFPTATTITASDVSGAAGTINNIRLWDPATLLEAYRPLQALRLYYNFTDVDVDRYTIEGRYRQVMLSARELDQSKLQAEAQTWVNRHLTYTHGYGAVVSRVNGASPEGLPEFFVQDIPPKSSVGLPITQPSIYYGELGADYVLVKTSAKEFDYPKGQDNVYSTYAGTGGVGIGSFVRQAAFALRFGTLKVLFSNYLLPDSRIMYRRAVGERVKTIAPFLHYDRDPYLVIRDDGSLAWIWDAYTTADRIPYSQPQAGVNYVRNSVKVVIDAFNGGVTFYQIDPEDAVANTWGKVFPGLFTPGDQLPADLRRHLRYPEDLFTIQASVLSTYHMTDAQVFYNKEDVWVVPKQIRQSAEIPVPPYYVIMALPGEPTDEFLLMQPFSPLNQTTMASWMAARMDGKNYGELVLYQFSKDKRVPGPSQVEATISNEPTISAQLTLWDQAGSQVIRGNLLVIPVANALIYVEPVYLQAEQSPIPELKRVIVSYQNRVVMEPTLGDALSKLFPVGGTTSTTTPGGTTTTTASGGTTTTTTPGGTTTTTAPGGTTTTTAPGPTPGSTTTTAPGSPLPTDAAALIALAQQHYQQGIDAQKKGDWAEYGRQIDELGRVLAALETVTK
jgi:hypothetical protein